MDQFLIVIISTFAKYEKILSKTIDQSTKMLINYQSPVVEILQMVSKIILFQFVSKQQNITKIFQQFPIDRISINKI